MRLIDLSRGRPEPQYYNFEIWSDREVRADTMKILGVLTLTDDFDPSTETACSCRFLECNEGAYMAWQRS